MHNQQSYLYIFEPVNDCARNHGFILRTKGVGQEYQGVAPISYLFDLGIRMKVVVFDLVYVFYDLALLSWLCF